MSPPDRPISWTVADSSRAAAPLDGRRVVVWALLCALVWVVSGALAYGAGQATASALPLSGSDISFERHRWSLAIWVAVWALLAPAAILAITQAMFGLPPKTIRRALPWMITGAAIAAWLELALLGWGFERFGPQGADPDLLGSAAYLAMLLVIVSTVVAAHRAAPAGYIFWGILATGLAALPVVAVIALNVETFARPDFERFAVLAPIVATGAYAWLALVFSMKFYSQSEDAARTRP